MNEIERETSRLQYLVDQAIELAVRQPVWNRAPSLNPEWDSSRTIGFLIREPSLITDVRFCRNSFVDLAVRGIGGSTSATVAYSGEHRGYIVTFYGAPPEVACA